MKTNLSVLMVALSLTACDRGPQTLSIEESDSMETDSDMGDTDTDGSEDSASSGQTTGSNPTTENPGSSGSDSDTDGPEGSSSDSTTGDETTGSTGSGDDSEGSSSGGSTGEETQNPGPYEVCNVLEAFAGTAPCEDPINNWPLTCSFLVVDETPANQEVLGWRCVALTEGPNGSQHGDHCEQAAFNWYGGSGCENTWCEPKVMNGQTVLPDSVCSDWGPNTTCCTEMCDPDSAEETCGGGLQCQRVLDGDYPMEEGAMRPGKCVAA